MQRISLTPTRESESFQGRYTKAMIDVSEEAFLWVKKNEKAIIRTFITDAGCVPDQRPASIFMAGTPGAGKTEVARNLNKEFKVRAIHIDADEIRKLCPGYAGENAALFQKAARKGVHILHDYALKYGYNLILDATFAYGNAKENIRLSIEKGRKPAIYFVYQEPRVAWEFTKAREATEKRNVPKVAFIGSYFMARQNVHEVKALFGEKVELNLIIKDIEKNLESLHLNIPEIDPFLPWVYSREELERELT